MKAEAFGSAHKERVEAEVNAWLLSEIRKAEARAATAEVSFLHFHLLTCCLVLHVIGAFA